MLKRTNTGPFLTSTQAADAWGLPRPTLHSLIKRGLFESELQGGEKGAWSRFDFDGYLRAGLLAAMNGWPISDDAKRNVARRAEAGRANYSPKIGGHRITRNSDGGSVSTYDPEMKLAPGEQCPRYWLVKLDPKQKNGVQVIPQDEITPQMTFGWTSFFVVDAETIFQMARKAFGFVEAAP